MPYIGAKELKASDIRRFDVTGSTSATHTLTWTAPNEQSLIVTINGVKQHEDAYSVSGTTLTLSSALVSTDKLEVIGINDIGTTITPAQNSVDADKIADDAVTVAKLNTTGTASSSTFLRGDMAWATPSDEGKVLQVVTVDKSDTYSLGTTATWTDITGLSVAITPSSTSSKILVGINLSIGYSVASTNMFRITRDGTAISVGDADGSRRQATVGWYTGVNSSAVHGNLSYNYLDSPSTTSAVTYKVQANIENATFYLNRSGRDRDNTSQDGRRTSNMILMEIAG